MRLFYILLSFLAASSCCLTPGGLAFSRLSLTSSRSALGGSLTSGLALSRLSLTSSRSALGGSSLFSWHTYHLLSLRMLFEMFSLP